MIKFNKRQQYALIILLVIVLFVSGYFIYVKSKNAQDTGIKVDIKNESSVLKDSKDEETKKSQLKRDLKVYITGLVKSPGVYTMRDGDRIDDAIKLAGGALDGADLTNINLAEKVKDEQMIKIPKLGENNGPSNNDGGNNGQNSFESKSNDGKININTASKAELDTLPGIGEVTAQRIIDFREQHGKFQKIEDIMNVSRIGPKLFEQIKDKITVD
ncbi:helix-hairpin-helix domain-containing protein [Thermoanaerobacterium sp. RBIITD]|uniref:helix-hairpin-helix domain-containing protein n=1 Tax=Thermoanaerobacterium sp. RBIITD TaxID=1550240 RepID=UPI000BB9377E|nr:helix-hairpin-helix domain-containing protein [Thermoanaerobacterium sp. RBIITD]SNX55171.1 competence protein ComEA [Thermoanaerobacterium sp. RBIITD]